MTGLETLLVSSVAPGFSIANFAAMLWLVWEARNHRAETNKIMRKVDKVLTVVNHWRGAEGLPPIDTE